MKKNSPETPETEKKDSGSLAQQIIRDAATRMIEMISSGVHGAWVKPWKGEPCLDLPFNPVTGHRYSGFNRVWLMFTMAGMRTTDPRFLSFNQAHDLGESCRVRKGAKACYVLRPVMITVDKDKKTGSENEGGEDLGVESTEKRVIFKPYPVFHASQIENMPDFKPAPPPDWEADTFIDGFMHQSGAEVAFGGDQAYYTPSMDWIRMPPKSNFQSAEQYYATLLHEWYHWTGHESRECRLTPGAQFGSAEYAVEELRAESFSVMAGMSMGLPLNLGSHAAYLSGWNEILQKKPNEIVKAMNQAGTMLGVVMEARAGEKPSASWWPEMKNEELEPLAMAM